MAQSFDVENGKTPMKIIPYVGCKSGFAHIFDRLVPEKYGKKIYDVFGGGGGFTFYACNRFGSKNIIYNDHNPVITNFMSALKKDPDGLFYQYQKHYKKSSPSYYLEMREKNLTNGMAGAGRFFYLAKNAFSGKIRFNSKNIFNAPMRKSAKCPKASKETIRSLSDTIKHLKITNLNFEEYSDVKGGFVYLDPPYMNNPNGHYNGAINLAEFVSFVKNVQKSNKVMISEQNRPKDLMLTSKYHVFRIKLRRSLQYFTQNDSKEIIAINYAAPRSQENYSR